MGKTSVLTISLLSLASVVGFNLIPRKVSVVPAGIQLAVLGIAIILWIAVIAVVFGDAKKRQKSAGWAGLALVLGGIGGLIYFFTIRKESD